MQGRQNYTGVDRSCSISHWKYKSKKRVNGKWRYYYDEAVGKARDALGYDERDRYKNAESNQMVKAQRRIVAQENAKSTYDKWDRTNNRDTRVKYKKEYDNDVNRYLKADREHRQAIERTNKAYSDFSKTPLGKLDRASKIGKSFLDKLFGK